MEIKVNEQAQRFYLAFEDKWVSGVGHEIKVGKYRFSAVPTEEIIIISELTTGYRVYEFPVEPLMLIGFDKEGTINLFMELGKIIKKVIIDRVDDFDKRIKNAQKYTTIKLGKKPETEDVDI